MPDRKIETLIYRLSRLPGMGSRSAVRVLVCLLKKKETVMRSLIDSLVDVFENTKVCEICNNIDVLSPCSICSDRKRDEKTICVVCDIADLWTIERAGFFRGKYHILGGKLSAVMGMTPDDLDIAGLCRRITDEKIEEVIIAMSADIDGKTTIFYINEQIKNLNVKVTMLSHGVPIGGELENLDNGTLIAAFDQRKGIC